VWVVIGLLCLFVLLAVAVFCPYNRAATTGPGPGRQGKAMTPLSILDLAPVLKGGTLAQTFANSVDLAQHAEAMGYGRVWLAEHHNMPGIASAATALVISQIAAATKTIRVGAGLCVPIWILGSSLFGAQLAAALGLPYAFASHFAPAALMQAIEAYRSSFEPSDQLDAPYVMLGVNVFAADTNEQARTLRSSQEQAILTHESQPLDPPIADFMDTVEPNARRHIDHMMECSATGSPEVVKRWLTEFARPRYAARKAVSSNATVLKGG
jgi:alkanesulfonate monooxygenase SsuD/methylene tetrahydromethanopterin reductase-like flavin-dependent oxidoreductase (luciferase family)